MPSLQYWLFLFHFKPDWRKVENCSSMLRLWGCQQVFFNVAPTRIGQTFDGVWWFDASLSEVNAHNRAQAQQYSCSACSTAWRIWHPAKRSQAFFWGKPVELSWWTLEVVKNTPNYPRKNHERVDFQSIQKRGIARNAGWFARRAPTRMWTFTFKGLNGELFMRLRPVLGLAALGMRKL